MVERKYFSQVVPKIFATKVDEELSRRFIERRATVTARVNATFKRLRRSAHESRSRTWRIRQRGVDEALRRRLQASWHRCHRRRSSSWRRREGSPGLHQDLG